MFEDYMFEITKAEFGEKMVNDKMKYTLSLEARKKGHQYLDYTS